MNIKTPESSKDTARRILKTEMIKKGVSNTQLAALMRDRGLQESQASINNKLSRGTFSAAFMVDALEAMGESEFGLHSHSSRVMEPSAQISLPLAGNPTTHLRVPGICTNQRSMVRWIGIEESHVLPLRHPGKVISLFTGAGGLDIGLEMAGFDTAVCVEIDADCRATLRHNRPDWLLYDKTDRGREAGNIRDIRASEMLEMAQLDVGEAALVVGGAPCQAFSNIGKREGVSDVDNGGDLFTHFVRTVKGTMPAGFIFENVSGITQSKHGEVLLEMKEQFSALGYGVSGCILNAANSGTPQKRERFILVGLRGVESPCLPLPTHAKDKLAWMNFIRDLAPMPADSFLPWTTVKDAFKTIPKFHGARRDFALMNISDFVVERMKLIGPGENFHVLPMEMRPQCWQSGKHQGQDTFGRLRSDQPSVTVRTAAYNPAKGRYIHPFENRGLSSHELASLQGFPSEWEFKSSKYDRVPLVSVGKQIGNAVPPLLGRAIGLALRRQLVLCPEY